MFKKTNSQENFFGKRIDTSELDINECRWCDFSVWHEDGQYPECKLDEIETLGDYKSDCPRFKKVKSLFLRNGWKIENGKIVKDDK